MDGLSTKRAQFAQGVFIEVWKRWENGDSESSGGLVFQFS
jgi:hypothetical protein